MFSSRRESLGFKEFIPKSCVFTEERCVQDHVVPGGDQGVEIESHEDLAVVRGSGQSHVRGEGLDQGSAGQGHHVIEGDRDQGVGKEGKMFCTSFLGHLSKVDSHEPHLLIE